MPDVVALYYVSQHHALAVTSWAAALVWLQACLASVWSPRGAHMAQ